MTGVCAVVLNPRSKDGRVGRSMGELQDELSRALGSDFDLEFLVTEGPRHATRLTREALERSPSLVLAVGGDGTFHEVVNGYFEGDHLVRDVPLALLTRGTGGDTRRTLDVPKQIDELASLIRDRTTRRIDLGLAEFLDAEGHPTREIFINVADLGVGGDVVARVNRSSKRWGGFLSFLSSTLVALWQYRPKQVEIRFDEGEPERHSLVILAVANCRFFGGGMEVAPPADPSDGLLDVVLVTDAGKAKLLRNLPRIYRGTHLGLRVVHHRRVRKVEARPLDESEGKVMLDLDGEQPGTIPVSFRVLPSALTVIAPALG